jgi:hypothetical protein
MQVGSVRKIAFILPFSNMVSNYVRAKCLNDYETNGYQFLYIQGDYPRIFNIFGLRTIYRHLFYSINLIKLVYTQTKVVVYFIKPNSPILLWAVRRILKLKVMIDVNDPYHLHDLMGANKTAALFRNTDRIVFESKEYYEYWSNKYSEISSIVSDTPQHECIYVNSKQRSRSFIWVGSSHTAPYLLYFLEYFKLLTANGYGIKFLGANEKILQPLRSSGVDFTLIEHYDVQILSKELETSLASFVPMPKEELFQLRGNLKAKVSMGHGCLTVASRMPMHESLISHGRTGYLFNTLQEFENILKEMQDITLSSKIAFEGNKYVADNYSRHSHAVKLIEVAETLLN